MAQLQPMYKAKVGSPETNIVGAISATDTQFDVVNIAAATPDDPDDIPNLLTIGGNRADAETVRVLEINGSTLTVERGHEGIARAWGADESGMGAIIFRSYGAGEHNAFIENIKAINEEIEGGAGGIGGNVTLENVTDHDTGENLVQILARHYAAIMGHVSNLDVHVTAGQMASITSQIADLIELVNQGGMLNPDDVAKWNKAAADALEALAAAQENAGRLIDHEGRIENLEDGLPSNIITNPSATTFEDLDGVILKSGNWNQVKRKVEF